MNLGLDLNIMTVQYFVTVAETGNMTKAAAKLYLTQPTLSRQIAALEQTLGVTLFTRTKGGVELTEQGEVFYRQCQELLEAYNRFSSNAFSFRNMTVGKIEIGYGKQSEVQVINLNNSFYQRYPNVEIGSHSIAGKSYYEELATRGCDCIFMYEGELVPEDFDKGIASVRVQDLEYRLLVSRANPLSEKDSVRLADLANEKFVFPDKLSYGHKYQRMYEDIRAYGYTPQIVDTAIYYMDYVMRCVYHNAVYLSPYIPVIGEYPQVKYLEIEDFDKKYEIDLVWMKNNKNPILSLYTEFAVEEISRDTVSEGDPGEES